MKRDIRELFTGEALENKMLPEHHRIEFLEKLKDSKISVIKPKRKFLVYKIAASVLLFVSLGYIINLQFINEVINENTQLVQQIETVEQKYLHEIDKEWQSFLALTTDAKLVKRYEKRLDDLNKNYIEISMSFKKNTNNILVIEELIENLKTRLQLLKDIQEHINILNSKNDNYETSI